MPEKKRISERAIVLRAAEDFKSQYIHRKKWMTYEDWELQPEALYQIARELRTVRAFNALMRGPSWTLSAKRSLARRPSGSAS